MALNRTRVIFIALAVLALVAGIGWLRLGNGQAKEQKSKPVGESGSSIFSLANLLALQPAALQDMDIARMNLTCAAGLPGAEGQNVGHCLAVLDEMANRVRTETERHLYRFRQDPAQFENSEGFFQMITMGVVLAEDFQVKYAPDKVASTSEAHIGDGFFADARDVFLHGLTAPERRGTCSSRPVLQVAMGRRLGYPLKLVMTKGHLFVRWEDAREGFNIEATGRGVNRFPDITILSPLAVRGFGIGGCSGGLSEIIVASGRTGGVPVHSRDVPARGRPAQRSGREFPGGGKIGSRLPKLSGNGRSIAGIKSSSASDFPLIIELDMPTTTATAAPTIL